MPLDRPHAPTLPVAIWIVDGLLVWGITILLPHVIACALLIGVAWSAMLAVTLVALFVAIYGTIFRRHSYFPRMAVGLLVITFAEMGIVLPKAMLLGPKVPFGLIALALPATFGALLLGAVVNLKWSRDLEGWEKACRAHNDSAWASAKPSRVQLREIFVLLVLTAYVFAVTRLILEGNYPSPFRDRFLWIHGH